MSALVVLAPTAHKLFRHGDDAHWVRIHHCRTRVGFAHVIILSLPITLKQFEVFYQTLSNIENRAVMNRGQTPKLSLSLSFPPREYESVTSVYATPTRSILSL